MSRTEFLTPIEGRKDCQYYTGFVGIYMHNSKVYGVMHCAWHEYLNAVCGATSKIGGILTERCDGCRHYKSEETGDKPEEEQ